jgi:Xaa-Pro aminopeptidase
MAAPEGRGTAAAVQARLEVVRELLAQHGARRAVLQSRRNFAWLTIGGDGHVVLSTDAAVAPIVIDARAARVLAPVNEADRLADEELAGLPFEIEQQPWETAPELGGDDDRRTLDDDAIEPELSSVRASLGDLEQQRMAWLGRRLTHVLDTVAADLKPGVTELEASAEIGRGLAADGIRAPVLLVAADDRIARYRHPLPTTMAIRQRAMLVAVAERWGLHVALTRLRELERPGADLDRRRVATQEVLAAMVAASVPGRTLGSIFEAARRAYADVGFPDEWRLHHQGGLLGYRPRERLATPGDPTVLAAGMAVAWNPSITGAKLESSHLLTDSSGQLRALTGAEPIHVEPTKERSAS